MEKSSALVLSDHEVKVIRGEHKLEKSASEGDSRVPERMRGWYTHEELQKLVG